MIIKDLSSTKELDREAMAQLRGGFWLNQDYLRRSPPVMPGPTFPLPPTTGPTFPLPKPSPKPVLW